MRADQLARLADLTEEVADVFLEAAHPENWTGAGQDMQSMDPATRGARNWDVKTANQIGALLARTLDLRDRITLPDDSPDDAAEADISKYERKAKDLIGKFTDAKT